MIQLLPMHWRNENSVNSFLLQANPYQPHAEKCITRLESKMYLVVRYTKVLVPDSCSRISKTKLRTISFPLSYCSHENNWY